MMDKKLLAYCGLYCPKCYKNSVSQAAMVLRREMLAASLRDACGDNPSLRESEPLRRTLDGLIAMKCPKPCRDGGGTKDCGIRACCLKKGIEGCWECAGFERCQRLKAQFVKNIMEIKQRGIENFVKGLR